MAHGSDEKYTLDLNDIIAFPDAAHLPAFPAEPGESWILLMEITAGKSFMGRPVFAVRDVTQTSFVVALYTPNPTKDARDFKIGHTLCMRNTLLHQFSDGLTGFRITDPRSIEVLPVSLNVLWEINAELNQRSDYGRLQKCVKCNNYGSVRCAVCMTLYCGKACQRADWPELHKGQCRVLKSLHRWNGNHRG